jgi:putative membrane protein
MMTSHDFVKWFWPPPPIASRLWPAVLLASLYSGIVFLICDRFELGHPAWAEEVGVLNVLIVSVLVGFRTRAAYDRWWEGRRLWGELTNEIRNLCVKAAAYARVNGEERHELARILAAFPTALMRNLRGPVQLSELPGFAKAAECPAHVPLYLADRVAARVAAWRASGALDGHSHQMLDNHISALMNVCGGCERIRNTPLPGSYLALLRHGLILSFLAAPWHLAISLGVWSIVVQAVLVYFLFGVELMAEGVEQPFAFDPDDLPLERYCETIRASVESILKD